MGIPTLIATVTGSDSGAVGFTSGIDSTYDEYMFVCTDMHHNTDDNTAWFQFNASGQSGYNETIMSTWVYDYHLESDAAAEMAYGTGQDQALGTAYQVIDFNMNNDADGSYSGILHLFNPSNTTYVKHFYSRWSVHDNSPSSNDIFVSGYINTTAAITDISFKCSNGTMDGTIQMYGIA